MSSKRPLNPLNLNISVLNKSSYYNKVLHEDNIALFNQKHFSIAYLSRQRISLDQLLSRLTFSTPSQWTISQFFSCCSLSLRFLNRSSFEDCSFKLKHDLFSPYTTRPENRFLSACFPHFSLSLSRSYRDRKHDMREIFLLFLPGTKTICRKNVHFISSHSRFKNAWTSTKQPWQRLCQCERVVMHVERSPCIFMLASCADMLCL